MSEFTQITTQDLWMDGRSTTISAQLIGTTLSLNWTPPANPVAYDGAVIVVGTVPQSGMEQPVDGTRYTPSSNFGTPAPGSNGMLGNAQVVAAYYGYFGDNVTTNTSVTVTNVDPTQIYYASIYICTNVLQYYSVGSQSYPLQSGPVGKDISPYAGSIPQAIEPPLNPYPGQAYFDPSANAVYIFDSAQQAWIRANQDTVRIGDEVPIQQYQLFFNTASEVLEFYDGQVWIPATPANLQVRMGSAWAPYVETVLSGANSGGGYQSMPTYPGWYFPPNATTGTFVFATQAAAISAPPTQQLWFNSLGQWFLPVPDQIQVWANGQWNPIAKPGAKTTWGNYTPVTPQPGYFFYMTSTRRLMAWTGTGWTAIDTDQRGSPTTSKVGVGTSGTNGARMKLMTDVKSMMGWPAICVELQESNFNTAIDNALAMFRQLADNAYEHRHISFSLNGGATGGQATYYLNDPRDGTDRIVNVMKIHRINQLGISSLSGETGLYAQSFFNQLYQGSNVDVLSIHLMNQLSKTYEKIFAGNLMFEWNEAKRELTILRRILQAQERVILEVSMEREEQELINDRWCRMWIQEWTLAELNYMLGMVRSKYGTVPGAQGGLTLNGDTLLAQADQMKMELRRQINDYEVGNGGVNFQNTAFYIG